MKTLKEELKEILNEKKLDKIEFICPNLSFESKIEIKKYREMASAYASEFITPHLIVWWDNYKRKFEDSGEEFNFVISEKYRFIQDLIKMLP